MPYKNRTYLLFVAICFVACLGVAAAAILLWFQSRPSSSLVPDTYDFGRVLEGEHVEHRFSVSNDLSRSVRIADVKKSCSCVVAGIPDELPPKRTCEVTLVADTWGRSGQYRTSVVLTTDEGRPIPLVLQGEVVRFHPREIDVGAVLRGAEVTREFTLDGLDYDALRVTGVEYDKSSLSLVRTEGGMRGRVNFAVSLNRDLAEGGFAFPIKFQTNHPRFKQCQVLIKGVVRSLVEVDRNAIFFQGLTVHETRVQTVTIRSPYGKTISSVQVIPKSTSLDCTARSEQEEPSRVSVVVTAKGWDDRTKPILTAELTIIVKCNDEERRIPLTITATCM